MTRSPRCAWFQFHYRAFAQERCIYEGREVLLDGTPVYLCPKHLDNASKCYALTEIDLSEALEKFPALAQFDREAFEPDPFPAAPAPGGRPK